MVYKVFESNSNEELPTPQAFLLAVVVSASDKMDTKLTTNITYATQIQYSPEYGADEIPSLKKLLIECWQRGSSKEIRCLSEHNSIT